jgi:hypothetical protein
MPDGPRPTLVSFLGDLGDSPIERLVAEARLAATLDTIEGVLASGVVSRALLVTDSPPDIPALPGLEVDLEPGEFHFGRRLSGVIRAHGLGSLIYFGGGSVPLLTSEDFAAICGDLEPGRGVTNNHYSSDLVAFHAGAQMLPIIEGLARDNSLARTLSDEAGALMAELPRRAETLFDIDSPADVTALKLTGRGGRRLGEQVQSCGLSTERYESVLPIFTDRNRQLIVAGRVGSHAWRYLESETACRVRLFAEERGMEADGRSEAGLVRSLLGQHLDAVGFERFFVDLADLGDAAVIDSRVLAAHCGATPSREDRFLSDAGQAGEIRDPFLRHLTEAAAEARIPVLLGGHSLVSGTLMLLNEHAWRLNDAAEPR